MRPDRPITGRCSRQVGYATLVRGLDPHHYRCRSQSPASYGWGLEHLDLPEHVRTSHRRHHCQAPKDGNSDERATLVTLPLVLWCDTPASPLVPTSATPSCADPRQMTITAARSGCKPTASPGTYPHAVHDCPPTADCRRTELTHSLTQIQTHVTQLRSIRLQADSHRHIPPLSPRLPANC